MKSINFNTFQQLIHSTLTHIYTFSYISTIYHHILINTSIINIFSNLVQYSFISRYHIQLYHYHSILLPFIQYIHYHTPFIHIFTSSHSITHPSLLTYTLNNIILSCHIHPSTTLNNLKSQIHSFKTYY